MPITHLWIVRHGECLGNVDAQRYPGPDTELTTLGKHQGQCVGQRLAALQITHLVSSPLLRALQTAQIIADQAQLAQFEVWMDLREGNHGDYWCEPRQRLAAAAPKATLPAELGDAGWLHQTRNNQQFTARCARVLDQVRQRFGHADRVALVTHGIVASNLLHALLGIPWSRPTWFELANGSLSSVRLVPDPAAERPGWELLPPVDVEVEYLNDVRHLLPTLAAKSLSIQTGSCSYSSSYSSSRPWSEEENKKVYENDNFQTPSNKE